MAIEIQTILQSNLPRGESGYSGYSGYSGVQGQPGTYPTWLVKTADYTAVNYDRIIADTFAGSFTITLPALPSAGSYVVITDGADWSINNLIIARNGSTIEGYSDDLAITLQGVTVELIYSGTTWRVTATTGAKGTSGYSGFSGVSGYSGFSGTSGYSGFSGVSGYSGTPGPSTAINATDSASGTALYPVMVAASGSNQTPTITSNKFSFNATTGTLSVTGNMQIDGGTSIEQIQETVNTKTSSTGTVVHDWATGAIFYHSSIGSNFTANFTNMPTTADRAYGISLVLNQGATGYYPNAVQINGSVATLRWANNTAPTPSTNKIDVCSFTLIYTGSTWYVLGQYSMFA